MAVPEGGCVLGGYCLGGLVAYTVAQQLSSAGVKVPLVVLFDTQTPGYPKFLRSRRSYLRHAGDWLRGRGKFSLRDVRSHLERVYEVAQKNAVQAVPAVAGFRMVHFLAGSDPVSTRVLEDPRLGWSDVCPAGVEVFYVDAHHDNLFHEAAIDKMEVPIATALHQAYGEP